MREHTRAKGAADNDSPRQWDKERLGVLTNSTIIYDKQTKTRQLDGLDTAAACTASSGLAALAGKPVHHAAADIGAKEGRQGPLAVRNCMTVSDKS